MSAPWTGLDQIDEAERLSPVEPCVMYRYLHPEAIYGGGTTCPDGAFHERSVEGDKCWRCDALLKAGGR